MRKALALCLLVCGCDDGGRNPDPRFTVEEVGLEVPKLSGWEIDPEVSLDDADEGGTVMRLLRPNAAAGSPRIQVYLAPKSPRPTSLDSFLNTNLRQMGDVERKTAMRIIRVNQEPVKVGPRRGYLVRHEYTIGNGDSQIAFTQLSTITVIDGRGVSVTALGRTELFHPLADSVARILTGLHVGSGGANNIREVPVEAKPAKKAKAKPPKPEPAPKNPGGAEPVDLGKIGGQ